MAADSPYGCWKAEDQDSKDDAIPSASPGSSALSFRIAGQGGAMHVIILESCHSTWIFEPRQLRFCRILKRVALGRRSASTERRPYRDLEIDPHHKAFTVQLDEAHTRLIRSSIHSPGCAECGGYETVKLSLEDIRRAAA